MKYVSKQTLMGTGTEKKKPHVGPLFIAIMKYSRLDYKERSYLAHTSKGSRVCADITSGLRTL